MDAVLLTAEGGGPGSVLPGLSLLTLDVHVAPLTTSALAASLDAPVIILDGRRDLVSARTLCRAATDPMDAPPILLVLEEGGFAVVAASWGAADTVLSSAPPAEIQARLRILREHATASVVVEDPPAIVEAGELTVDPISFKAEIGGRRLDLTYKEFELLRYLANHPGQVLSRETLLEDGRRPRASPAGQTGPRLRRGHLHRPQRRLSLRPGGLNASRPRTTGRRTVPPGQSTPAFATGQRGTTGRRTESDDGRRGHSRIRARSGMTRLASMPYA